MTTTEHTPTPWQTAFDDMGGYDSMTGSWHIGTHDRKLADIDQADYGQKPCDYDFRSQEAAANAAFVVRAVNSHDALVEALEAMNGALDRIEAQGTDDETWHQACQARIKANAALKLAKRVNPWEGLDKSHDRA